MKCFSLLTTEVSYVMVVVHVPCQTVMHFEILHIALLLNNRSNDVQYSTFYMLVCRLACLWFEVTARNSSRMTVRCCSRVVSSLLPVSLSIYLSLSPSLSLSLSLSAFPSTLHEMCTLLQCRPIVYIPPSLSLSRSPASQTFQNLAIYRAVQH